MFPKSINGKVRNSDVRFEVFLSQFRRGTPQIEEKKNKNGAILKELSPTFSTLVCFRD